MDSSLIVTNTAHKVRIYIVYTHGIFCPTRKCLLQRYLVRTFDKGDPSEYERGLVDPASSMSRVIAYVTSFIFCTCAIKIVCLGVKKLKMVV